MSLRLKIQDPALKDLARITGYIARQNKDWTVARRFGRRLVERCIELRNAPGAGAPSAFGPEVRKINEGAYKIYYRVENGRVSILRIWDGRRGIEPRLDA
jgi:plasmid stabilization system protein ParE